MDEKIYATVEKTQEGFNVVKAEISDLKKSITANKELSDKMKKGYVTDLNSIENEIEGKIATINAKMEKIANAQNGIEAKVLQKIEAKLKLLQKNFVTENEIKDMIKTVDKDMIALSQNQTKIDDKIEALDKRKDETNHLIKNIETNGIKAEKVYSDFNERVGDLEKDCNRLDQHEDQLESMEKAHSREIEAILKNLKEIKVVNEQKISEIETKIAKEITEINTKFKNFEKMIEKVAVVEKKFEEQIQEMLDDKDVHYKQKMSTMQTDIDNNNSDFKVASGKIISNVSKLNDRFNKFEKSKKEDIKLLKEELSNEIKELTNTEEIVASMESKFSDMQLDIVKIKKDFEESTVTEDIVQQTEEYVKEVSVEIQNYVDKQVEDVEKESVKSKNNFEKEINSHKAEIEAALDSLKIEVAKSMANQVKTEEELVDVIKSEISKNETGMKKELFAQKTKTDALASSIRMDVAKNIANQAKSNEELANVIKNEISKSKDVAAKRAKYDKDIEAKVENAGKDILSLKKDIVKENSKIVEEMSRQKKINEEMLQNLKSLLKLAESKKSNDKVEVIKSDKTNIAKNSNNNNKSGVKDFSKKTKDFLFNLFFEEVDDSDKKKTKDIKAKKVKIEDKVKKKSKIKSTAPKDAVAEKALKKTIVQSKASKKAKANSKKTSKKEKTVKIKESAAVLIKNTKTENKKNKDSKKDKEFVDSDNFETPEEIGKVEYIQPWSKVDKIKKQEKQDFE